MHSSLSRMVPYWMVAIALLACSAIAPASAPAGVPGLIAEDVDDDGVYDARVDRDVTATVLAEGSFATPHSILVAKGLSSRHVAGIALVAGKNIRVNADLNVLAAGAGLSLIAQEGKVVLGTRANVAARGYIDVMAASGIEVGALVSLQSRESGGGLFLATDGNIIVADRTRLSAKGGMDLFALGGEVHIGPRPAITASSYISVTTGGPAWITDGHLQTPSLSILATDAPVTFSGNVVKFSGGGFAYLAGGSVDISDTSFSGLDPENLIIDERSVPE